jgi:ERCC4-type nuclease
MPMDTTLQNLLLRNGIESVEQLQKLSWGQLLTLRGVGEGKATRIRKALAMFKQ